MKALVTGVAGQLGHDVMNELAKRGFEGVGSDLAPGADPEETVSDRQFVRHWLYENQPCLEAFWY